MKLFTGTPSISVIVSPPRPPRIRIGLVTCRRDSVNEMMSVLSGTWRKPCWSRSAPSMLTTGSERMKSPLIGTELPVVPGLISGVNAAVTTISPSCWAAGWSVKSVVVVTSMANVTLVRWAVP